MTPQRVARNEDGASLIIAMLFVTVVSFITIALLGFADTGIRTTEGLRRQGDSAAAADGAAQLAVNALRKSTFTYESAHCFGTQDTLSLPAFPTRSTQSAVVSCAPRADTPPAPVVGVINGSNTPGDAILTLGSSALEGGIGFGSTPPTFGGPKNTLNISGKVRSNSTINTGQGILKSDTSIAARGSCTPASGLDAPVKTCSTGGVSLADPNYAAPGAATPPPQTVPNCPSNGGLVTFNPGLYTDAYALSACDKGNITMWFKPGTYYFNFPTVAGSPAASVWTMDQGYMVAGTPSGNIATSLPVMPGSCAPPFPSASAPTVAPAANAGVEFVFGGQSHWVVGGKSHVEMCGSYSPTAPPIAIYGLKSSVNGVPAESGCVTAISLGCSLVSSTTNSQDRSELHVQGTMYAPIASMELSAVNQGNHQTNMYLNAGIVVRSLEVFVDGVVPHVVGVPGLTTVALPQRLPESVAWLQVFICANTSPCTSSTGRLQLRAKVGVSEPTDGAVAITAGARSVKIYSWAVER